MKLKLVSDGTAPRTWLEGDNGEKIQNVTAISWKIDTETGISTMVVETVIPKAQIDGENFYVVTEEKTVTTYRHGFEPEKD